MHSSWPLPDLVDLPLSCTLCLVHEGVIGAGWLWELSAGRCLVQSPLRACPGMVVKVSVQMSELAPIRMEGLVTWARESEFSLLFLHDLPPMSQEETID